MGLCKISCFGLILVVAQTGQPRGLRFSKAPQLCQIRQALPFVCHASLAKGLYVHISLGFLGVRFCDGVLFQDWMAVSIIGNKSQGGGLERRAPPRATVLKYQ